MEVYCYNSDGIYSGSTAAQPNPMAHMPGEPPSLIPARATTIVPPSVPTGKLAKWTSTGSGHDDGSWSLVDDPAYLTQQALLRAQNVVVFYRKVSGKDDAVLAVSRFGLVAGAGTILYNSLPLSDPSNAQVGALEMDPFVVGADAKNVNGVSLKKVVGTTVVDRDPSDVFLDDGAAQIHRVVIFYRNRGGNFDTAVLAAQSYRDATASGAFLFQGKPISDPANQFVSFIHSDTLSIDQATISNANGVPLKMVVNGALADRDPAAVARDFRNEPNLRLQANQAMASALKAAIGVDMPYPFHLLVTLHLFFVALNLDGNQSTDQIASAKQALSNYNQAAIQVNQIWTNLNQQLSQLEANV